MTSSSSLMLRAAMPHPQARAAYATLLACCRFKPNKHQVACFMIDYIPLVMLPHAARCSVSPGARAWQSGMWEQSLLHSTSLTAPLQQLDEYPSDLRLETLAVFAETNSGQPTEANVAHW